MQKLLSLVVLLPFFLVGCGGGGGGGTSTNTTNTMNFTTSGGSGLRPSLLNLAGSNDGTLNIINTGSAAESNPIVAMNSLDGWSLSQPIIFPMSSGTGANLSQPSFSTQAGAIQPMYVLEVTFDRSNQVPNGVAGVLIPGTDYTPLASEQRLIISPLKPLKPGAYYMVAFTDGMKDATGSSLSAASDYITARNSAGSTQTSALMNALITAQENLMAAIQVPKERLIFTDTFKTTSAGEALRMVKLAASVIVGNAIAGNKTTTGTEVWRTGDVASNQNLSNIYNLDLTVAPKGTMTQVLADTAANPQGAAAEANLTAAQAGALTAAIANAGLNAVAGATNVYKTTVKLPYFSGHPTQSAQAPGVTPWKGASPSLISISKGLAAGGATANAIAAALATRNIDATKLASLITDSTKKGELASYVINMAGLNIQVPDGNGGNQALDEERNVTEYNSLPQLTTLTDVPVLLFAAGALNTVQKVVIFQHGITSIKENVYSLAMSIVGAGQLAGQNVAVMAIDLPLHGERGFPGFLTNAANPSVYANLGFLKVARDNLRQSAADLIGLRAALSWANRKAAPTLGVPNALKVSLLGHSLGGIVGANFLAISNEATAYTSMQNHLFRVDETALAMPGAQLAHIMYNSPTFGPAVTHDVITAGNAQLLAAFTAFKTNCQDSNEKTCFTTQFIPTLDAATQKTITDTMTSFVFAAQTVIDPADPFSTASSVSNTDPILMIEVVGDKGNNKADQVIPNAAGLSGTESLARQLGLANLTGAVVAPGPVRHIARFTRGGHGSLITPDTTFDAAGAATAEIQAHVSSFFAGNGAALNITNQNVLCLDTAANCLP